jgi:hypothetical protein
MSVSRDTRPHSPLPWRVEVGTDGVSAASGHRTEIRSATGTLVARTDSQALSGRRSALWNAEDDAQYIVDAVNAYSPPVAEASEDTEPARCQTCDGAGYTLWRGLENNCNDCPQGRARAAESALHPDEWPTPASDVEMTPGPSVFVQYEVPEGKSYQWVGADNPYGVYVPAEVEAAIRAPLEARIEREIMHRDRWGSELGRVRDQLAVATAERDKEHELRANAEGALTSAYNAFKAAEAERDRRGDLLIEIGSWLRALRSSRAGEPVAVAIDKWMRDILRATAPATEGLT